MYLKNGIYNQNKKQNLINNCKGTNCSSSNSLKID